MNLSETRPLRLHLDIETRSRCDLKSQGVYVYAKDLSTKILCLCFRFGHQPVELWLPSRTDLPWSVLEQVKRKHPTSILHFGRCPDHLRRHIESGGEVAAHNAQFERTVLNGVAGQGINFPTLRLEQMVCTAAKARTHGLPGNLGDAASALSTYPKDETARGTMLMLCRPRNGKVEWYEIEEVPEKFAHLYTYCIEDVLAEADLDDNLADLTDSERQIWFLDQKINDRGVRVDVPMIKIIEELIAQYKAEMEVLCRKLTTDEIDCPEGLKPTQREKLAEWVRSHGYSQLTDMTADNIRKAGKDIAMPTNVRLVLQIFSTYGMKAISKYSTMLDARGSDDRIRGMFLYYGAGTGRWSSSIVQLQNLFRPVISDCDTAIESFKSGDLALVKFLYDGVDPMKVFASCVRGMLIPEEGSTLQSVDFAGIESRVLAWVFDEKWKVEAFRASDSDKSKPDNYKLAYSMCFGVPASQVNKRQRQIGKPIDLGLGYEGGVGAFCTMAPNYQVDLEELRQVRYTLPPEAIDYADWMWVNIECKRGNSTELDYELYTTIEGIKYQWRAGHPSIKQGWKDILEAAKRAVQEPGKVWQIPNGKIKFLVKDKWLKMRLPSGRMLNYFKPSLTDKESQKTKLARVDAYLLEHPEADREATENDVRLIDLKHLDLSYYGTDTDTRRWMRTGTYGGKLTENAVQAIAGDLLRGAMLRAEAAGYKIIMTVHDEIVSEIAHHYKSLKEAEATMCVPETWADGLPIAAEGWRAQRFRK